MEIEISFTRRLSLSLAEGVIVSADGKNGCGINLCSREDTKTIILNIKTVGAGKCVSEGDRVYINFLDGTKMELSHMGGFDYDATTSAFLGGTFGNKKAS